MDTGLWAMYTRELADTCYKGKIAPVCQRDSNGKLIRGPLVLKTDAGPGRLSKEAESIEFRSEMAEKGLHIMLSLPNATACTAELDQIYSKFQPECKKSTLRVAGMKMVRRVEARKKFMACLLYTSPSPRDS